MEKKVLILEDEVITANTIQSFLQKNGYHGLIATEPVKAKELFEENDIDIVISDINLSGETDGVDFVREVIKGRVPVIFLTAYSDPETMKRTEGAMPYAYLTKPFNNDQLLLTLNLAIGNSKKRFLHYENDNFTDLEVELTNREIDIVQQLAQGKITEEIALALSISPQTVSTHRKNILRKTKASNIIELISLAVEMKWV